MVAQYARIARRSAVMAAVVAVVMAALFGALVGGKGLIGAVIAAAVVALFFGISVVTVSRAARISPQVMMATALGTFIVKILLLLAFVGAFEDTTAFNPSAFGLTALACILAYTAGHVVWSIRLNALYVEPDGER
jgi:ATP synthase protein I